MAEVRIDRLSKSFGAVSVLSGLDLSIPDGEFLVLVGPSGCGKTTALRLVAGLDEPTSGTVSIGGRVVNGLPPRDRDIAMVFQSYALYPHMTVRENLAFSLVMRKVPRADADARLKEASDFLGLDGYLDRLPKDLSGGQRQRVALGRALVRRPQVFLFDEPLSNLDAALRVKMRAEISRLQERTRTTSIYVTHDQVEAMTLGHRIAVLRDGVLQQVGPPLDVYRNPANLFVAGFLGTPPINRLRARVTPEGTALAGDGFTLPVAGRLRAAAGRAAGRSVVAAVRPEHLHAADAPERAPLEMRVEMVEPLGHEMVVHGTVGSDPGAPLAARMPPGPPPHPGTPLRLFADLDGVFLFDETSGARLDA